MKKIGYKIEPIFSFGHCIKRRFSTLNCLLVTEREGASSPVQEYHQEEPEAEIHKDLLMDITNEEQYSSYGSSLCHIATYRMMKTICLRRGYGSIATRTDGRVVFIDYSNHTVIYRQQAKRVARVGLHIFNYLKSHYSGLTTGRITPSDHLVVIKAVI